MDAAEGLSGWGSHPAGHKFSTACRLNGVNGTDFATGNISGNTSGNTFG